MLNAKFMRAKTILKEEIEMTQSKLQSGAEAESQDVILKGISAAQQRLKELNAVDDSDDIEDQENTNTNRLKRRKSLIEKQLEMKEHVQCVQIFLNSLSTL